MPQRRKCRHCNTENPDSVMYCVSCGKYLTSVRADEPQSQPMYGYGMRSGTAAPSAAPAVNPLRQSGSTSGAGYIVVCPVCKKRVPTQRDILPMSCSQCGYFFQVGQDSVISVDSTQSSVSASPASAATMSVPVAQPAAASNPAPAAQNSPMPAVSNDRSELRLFWMNRTGEMPVQIPQNGATLGAKGALLKKLPGNTLFMIWHTRAGWYLRCIQGALLYNGKPVNLNNDMRLLNNDLLIIGSEQFRVEVI